MRITAGTAFRLLLLPVMLLSVACQSAIDTPAGTPAEAAALDGQLVFRAGVGDLLIRTESSAQGQSAEDTAEVRLPGRLLEPPREIALVSKEAADRKTPLAAAASDYSAFRADDDDWILENFSDDNREEVLGLLADQNVREANRRVFAALGSMQVWGEAEWQGYRLVLTRYNGESTAGVVVTFVKTPEGWKRTNALRSDETFDVVLAAFRSGTVTAAE